MTKPKNRFGAPPPPEAVRDNLAPEPSRPVKDLSHLEPVALEGMPQPPPVADPPTDRPVVIEGRGRRKVSLHIPALDNLEIPTATPDGLVREGDVKEVRNISLRLPYKIYRDIKASAEVYGLTLGEYMIYAHSKARYDGKK